MSIVAPPGSSPSTDPTQAAPEVAEPPPERPFEPPVPLPGSPPQPEPPIQPVPQTSVWPWVALYSSNSLPSTRRDSSSCAS